jgi:nucleotide-binding universal stress UspA family protein
MEKAMTDLLARTAKSETSLAPEIGQSNGRAPLRVLAVVDGTECDGRVTRYLLGLQARQSTIEVVLLNIQPLPAEGRLRGYGSFHRKDVEGSLIDDLGQRVVTSAGRHLEMAGIPHTERIEIGYRMQTIVRCAGEENCDLIVVAEPEPGALRTWLMRGAGIAIGSIASTSVHFVNVPVVVAK